MLRGETLTLLEIIHEPQLRCELGPFFGVELQKRTEAHNWTEAQQQAQQQHQRSVCVCVLVWRKKCQSAHLVFFYSGNQL